MRILYGQTNLFETTKIHKDHLFFKTHSSDRTLTIILSENGKLYPEISKEDQGFSLECYIYLEHDFKRIGGLFISED